MPLSAGNNWQLSAQQYELWKRALKNSFFKANIELIKPNCRLCFEVLASVLISQTRDTKIHQDPLKAGPGCHQTCVSLCSPLPGRSHTGFSLSPWALGAAGGLPPVPSSSSSAWKATQPAAPTQAVQTRSGTWAVALLALTLPSPLSPCWLQKHWEPLTSFSDDLCYAGYLKHKPVFMINK